MNNNEIRKLAQYLYNGEKNRQKVVKLTDEKAPGLTIDEAYIVQKDLIKLREKEGHKIFAPKMGLTSRAKWEQMGVDSPIVGYIFEDMIEKDDTVDFSKYIHPKLEPEIAIVLKNEMSGCELTIEDVLQNIDYILSCAEIIDSRYLDFDFTLPDVIADNTSAKGAIFGTKKISIENIEMELEKVVVKQNNNVVAEGQGSAVLGHPAEAIIELAKFLSKDGKNVPSGVPIMTGGLTSALLINPGDEIEISYSNLGTLKIDVK